MVYTWLAVSPAFLVDGKRPSSTGPKREGVAHKRSRMLAFMNAMEDDGPRKPRLC